MRIMPVRTFGDFSLTRRHPLADGIRYAIRNGARVIVITSTLDQYLHFIVPTLREAESARVLVVCSAGNAGQNRDDDLREIGSLSNVLLVTGSRKDGSWAGLSYGKIISAAAPCGDMQLLSFDEYAPVPNMGTSWAAPIAAAVAATLLSQEPGLTPNQIIERIRRCSVMHESMRGKLGGGRIDMLRVIRNVPADVPPNAVDEPGFSDGD